MQVAADVLNVLGFLRVDVARQWMALTVVEHHPLDELQELIRREKDARLAKWIWMTTFRRKSSTNSSRWNDREQLFAVR